MFNTVVVPVDRSKFAESAIPYAAGVVRRTGGTLHLAMVNTIALPDGVRIAPVPMDPTFDREMRREANEYLQTLVDRIATAFGVRPQFRLLDGPIAEAIAGHVRELEADLVVLSTHGRGGLKRAWLGSVADRLIRKLNVPLLLIRPEEDGGQHDTLPSIGSVLVALDGSVLAEAALRAAHAIAGPAARCTAVRVAVPPLGPGSPYLPDAARLTRETLEQEQNRAAEYMEGIARRLRGDWAHHSTEVVTSYHPAAAILDAAREEKADLVAIATHGRRPLMRAVLGSVADKVIRGAELPVLVVPAHAADAGLASGHADSLEQDVLT